MPHVIPAYLSWKFVVQRWRLSTVAIEQRQRLRQITMGRALRKIIGSFECCQLFSHRAHDELIQGAAVLSCHLFSATFKRNRQSNSISISIES